MELSTSIHEDSRYISKAESNKKRTSDHTEIPRKRGSEVVEDHRQDVHNESQQRTWTVDIASTMQNMFCQGPCFVNTIDSMDSGNSPDNRMEAPATPRKDDEMALSGSSLHASPSRPPPVRFPSIHLASGDWDSGLEDSAFLDVTEDGVPITPRIGVSQHESIYRTPSNSEAFSKASQERSSNRTVNNGGASIASTIDTTSMSKYGLYRCPAWSDDADDEDDNSDVVSIAGDEDWNDIAPADSYNRPLPYRIQQSEDSKTVIDVTHMEELFNDFSVSGRHDSGTGFRN